MKKKLSKLLRWETMLVVLLIVLWVVFEARDNGLDAALIAKGRKAKDVFNFSKMLNGMGVSVVVFLRRGSIKKQHRLHHF